MCGKLNSKKDIISKKETEIFSECAVTKKVFSSCTPAECCVEKTLNVIGGKWSFLILKNLFNGKKRFGELKRLLPNCNSRSMTICLRSLEKYKIITRTVYPTVPTTVEYELTEKGKDLKDVIISMYIWGEKWEK